MNPENRKFVPFKAMDGNMVDGEQRLAWHWISTTDVDMIGDVVMPEGMDDKTYFDSTRSVNLDHQPTAIIGTNRNLAVKAKNGTRGVYAQTYISQTALGADVWTMMKEGVIRGWSIEWDPSTLVATAPTDAEKQVYGQACKRLFRQWTLTSYAATAQPMNPHCVTDGMKNATYIRVMEPIWERMKQLFTQGMIHRSSAIAAGFPDENPMRRVFSVPAPIVVKAGGVEMIAKR